MADVRLTAINPDDSEVYPVACNDKGELILNGASRLEVSGFLDVASTTYADNTGLYLGQTPGNINFREIRLNKDGSAQFSKVVQVGGFVSYVRSDSSDQNIARFSSDVGGLNVDQITLKADGSATFAGGVESKFNVVRPTADGNPGFISYREDGIPSFFIYPNGNIYAGPYANAVAANQTYTLRGDTGAATFAGDVNASAIQATQPVANYRTFNGRLDNGGTVTDTAQIFADGSAQFSGNVTAPNITFKLAPATAASMPAPLIDEGFAQKQELDLLSELIKMKMQIRDLNAFMQRTLQDGAETQQ